MGSNNSGITTWSVLIFLIIILAIANLSFVNYVTYVANSHNEPQNISVQITCNGNNCTQFNESSAKNSASQAMGFFSSLVFVTNLNLVPSWLGFTIFAFDLLMVIVLFVLFVHGS